MMFTRALHSKGDGPEKKGCQSSIEDLEGRPAPGQEKKTDSCCCPARPFRFYKLDAQTGAGLPGAVFELRCRGTVMAVSKSAFNGAVCFPPLYPGQYTLEETTPPEGYAGQTTVYCVTASPCGTVCVNGIPADRFAVCDTRLYPITGSFTLTKRSDAGRPLEGAVFQLKSVPGGITTEAATDADGKAAFQDLAPGSYTLEETTPPEGYAPSSAVRQVMVREDGTVTIDGQPPESASFLNYPEPNSIRFSKRDRVSGAPISGAEFELRAAGVIMARAVSNESGWVTFSQVPPGTYQLRESTAAAGYLPYASVHIAIVGQDGAASIDGLASGEFTILNAPLPAFRVNKNNSDRLPLAGVGFTLRRNGRPVQAAVTDASGNAVFSALAPGSYTLSETEPPAGYIPDTTIHNVTVEATGTILLDGEPGSVLPVINRPIRYDVFFTKLDSQFGTPVEGAAFDLLSGGAVAASAVSDTSGRVHFGQMPAGTYTLRETAPASGYQLVTQEYPVVVSSDGSVSINSITGQDFLLSNIRTARLRILKTNESGAPLAGAVFQLSGGEGQTVVTDLSGRAELEVRPGTYQLRESSPPPGYEPSSEEHQIVAGQDGSLQIDGVPGSLVTVANQRVLLDVTGRITWNDRNNQVQTRSQNVTMILYQDGREFQRVSVPTEGTGEYAFSSLPRFRPDGSPYSYTVGEEELLGYQSTVSGYQVTNTLKLVLVQTSYMDDAAQTLIGQEWTTANYGSSLTLRAQILPGYQLISPETYTFPRLTQDEQAVFHYIPSTAFQKKM